MALKPQTRSTGREKEARRAYDQRSGSARERGYTWQWEKESKAYLAENPLCAECMRQGRVSAATCVDHIIPHRGNMELFWDRDNWQGLCATPCHAAKTARGE
jgi:5-methylcytosine-specific restriction protein A